MPHLQNYYPLVDLPVNQMTQMQLTWLYPDYVTKLPYLVVATNAATHAESPPTTNPMIQPQARKDATPHLQPNRRTKPAGVQSRRYGFQLLLLQLSIRTTEYRLKRPVERTRPSVFANEIFINCNVTRLKTSQEITRICNHFSIFSAEIICPFPTKSVDKVMWRWYSDTCRQCPKGKC